MTEAILAMTARERLEATLNHCQPDRVCVDFGSTAVTGMHASAVSRLRRAVLGDPDFRVKVIEPYQMLGEIDDELRAALGIDVVGILGRKNLFGFENRDWKPFDLFDGTPVLVPGHFNVREDENGDLLIYPEGDLTARPSGRMPRGGWFFDTIIRQEPIDETRLNVEDNLEEFGPLSEEDLRHFATQAERLYNETSCGIIASIPGTAFGDIALVPAPWMKRPKGIRDVEEWYISTVARRDYVYKVFERQCEIALGNIERLAAVMGDKVQAAFVTGTDFGTQRGLFISPQTYRDLYKPFHAEINRAVHEKTCWRTLIHTCGSVYDLIPDFIEAGFDILNPVQTSAAKMDPVRLKREFGREIVFWGGGVDTQRTLAFGTPQQVYAEVIERIEILGEGGGFVFNAIHNVQGNTPTENILAMFQALADARGLGPLT
ncbi:MAG: methyltransferase [Armatimonadetes bacterium]|nr:methyltransferase [Armatimonadota bacterium]